MLDLIRNNIQSFGVKFIVAVVVVVMVFFGVTAFQSQGINTVASIDGYELKVERYQRALDQAQYEIRQQYQQYAAEYMQMIDLPSQIVQRLVNNVLLLKAAEKNGLVVTDRELAQAIFETPEFHTDGRFDEDKYARMLADNRIDRITYEKELRENLLTRKLISFLNGGVLISRRTIEAELLRYNTEANIDLIEITPVMFIDQVTVTAEDLQRYYEANKLNYQQQRQFVLRYVVLAVEDLEDQVTVRDNEIQRYYDRNRNTEFATKASFHARHILIPIPEDGDPAGIQAAKDKAGQLYARLLEDRRRFEALAIEHSADRATAEKGGDLGWVTQGMLVDEFERAIDRLEVNDLARPFLTQFGYHIVELLDRKPATVRPLDDVKAEIEATLRAGKGERRLRSRVETIINSLTERSLDDVAVAHQKTAQITSEFDDAANLADIGHAYPLYQAIKSKRINESGVHYLEDGQRAVIYRIESVIDPFVKPLEAVQENVEYQARLQKAQQMAEEKARSYGLGITTRPQFEQVARELGVESQSLQFRYVDNQAGPIRISDDFRRQVFSLENGATAVVSDPSRSYLIMMVDKKVDTDAAADRELSQQLEAYLKRQKAGIFLDEFIQRMYENIEVEYNQQILSALNIRFRE